MKGVIPWIKGKHHSEKTKEKMSESQKGKIVSEETRIKLSKISKGKKLSEETKEKIRDYQVKKWEGVERKKYKRYIHLTNTYEYREWRSNVFQRDNWTCQTCGMRSKAGEPIYLEAHHIKSWAKYPKLRYEINNGITLCRECHKLTRKICLQKKTDSNI